MQRLIKIIQDKSRQNNQSKIKERTENNKIKHNTALSYLTTALKFFTLKSKKSKAIKATKNKK